LNTLPAPDRYQILLETADVSVNRFDHPPDEAHEDPEEELASRWAIAFVLAGSFDIEVKGKRRRLRPGSVLLTRPEHAFRFRHGEQCPTDVCLSIGFGPDTVSGIEEVWERPARVGDARLAYVERRIRRHQGADGFDGAVGARVADCARGRRA
jgi:hypothetical protein